jgi:MerR family transcriptional regulator, thiopeptide resistance regulator
VALKFIGFSLSQIKDVLRRNPHDLVTTLRLQREIMVEKRRHVQRAIEAIEFAEFACAGGSESGADALRRIIEVIEMQNNMDWSKYYSPEAQAKLAAARERDPDAARRGQEQWSKLLAEVEQALRERVDPASERAQQLAARWSELIHAFTQGDPEIENGLKAFYSDQQNWPSTFKKPYRDEAAGFICAAQAARKP